MQFALPQHRLSRCAATRVRTPWFKNLLIRGFLRLFDVDMGEALETDPYRYGSFNDFFTRALRPDTRPVAAAAAAIASPVDGMVSECGAIDRDELLQAKGRRYRLAELLAGEPWAGRFEGGSFATIYLAPFNYHRIHMPVRPVARHRVCARPPVQRERSHRTARARLFARNERVLTLFEGECGQFAVVLVGALNVGSMATVWAGDITPAARRAVTHIPAPRLMLEKGAELGRFNMGSTVILLFEANRARWHPLLRAGSVVQFGQAIGSAE